MLSQLYGEKLPEILAPRGTWHPYPTAAEREAWESLPQTIRQAHLARGEESERYGWSPLFATRFLDYARNGNRSRYERISRGRRGALADLVIAECMEGRGRFLDDITNGIWAICEESFWGVPAHISAQQAGVGLPDVGEPIVDLFAAETSALLCWAAYLLGPALGMVSPLVVPRIEHEVQRRILSPLLERDDFGWMGFGGGRVNNWNPWICSNWLTSALLLESDEERRLASVAKAVRALDNFIDGYPADGGCDEGPSYWGRAGASLYDCLELLRSATEGQIDVYGEPLVQEIGRFIYRVQIAGTYFVNFADAPAILTPSPGVVFGYGKRIDDPAMVALGAWSAQEREMGVAGAGDSIGRMLPTLFSCEGLLETAATPPLPRDVWLSEIEVMVARDRAGSPEGLFVAAKGGHNAESHNHNDVGSFVVYADGKPVIIDAGVESYTRKTFSSQRYDIWTMQSAYHSLPTVNGVGQAPGASHRARGAAHRADDGMAELTLDIAPAYPDEAGINSWVRTIALERAQQVTVTDEYDLEAAPGELTLSLLTPCDVRTPEAGVVMLGTSQLPDGRASGKAVLRYDGEKLELSAQALGLEDARLQGIWGERLTRIILRAKSRPLRDKWQLRIAPD